MLSARVKLCLAALWLVFTVSLAIWWYVFTQKQISSLLAGEVESTAELLRDQLMLKSEGLVLISLLLVGGFTLLFYIYRELREKERIRSFFLTFSHELKTPLSSLRLRAEALSAQAAGSPSARHASKIAQETVRLHSRLENSLFLADFDHLQMVIENIELSEILNRLALDYPETRLELSHDAQIEADQRMIEIVLRNLIQNSITHGRANTISVLVRRKDRHRVEIEIQDDGIGLQGDINSLSKPFTRHYSGSGSGIGLYLCRKILKRMKAKMHFEEHEGFHVHLLLPGILLERDDENSTGRGRQIAV